MNHKTLFTLAFVALSYLSFAQVENQEEGLQPPPVSEEPQQNEIFEIFSVEVKPQYPTCATDITPAENFECFQHEVMMHVVQKFEYPEEARQAGEQGKAYVSFVINKKGRVEGVEVVRSSGSESIDREAQRVISTLPRMTPALIDGKPVNIRYVVPISAKFN